MFVSNLHFPVLQANGSSGRALSGNLVDATELPLLASVEQVCVLM